MQKINKVYEPLLRQDYRYGILLGGRAAGRSHFVSQYAIANLRDPQYFRCAVMRFIKRDVRNSIYKEIEDRMKEIGLEQHVKKNDQQLSIEYNNNIIKGFGFRKSSSSNTAKLKSIANYNCVIIEEADEVAEEDFMQLEDSLRTKKGMQPRIILNLNPPSKDHWIIKRWFNLVEHKEIEGFFIPKLKKSAKDTIYIHSTYKNNKANLDKKSIERYERYKETNPSHYYNMIEGLVTEGKRGRIFRDWQPMTDKEFEELPYPVFYGLDFGFTNDPTALIEIKQHNDKVYCRELIYETGLTNQMIASKMESLGVDRDAWIYADSAEPKSIQEIKRHNWNIRRATKGKDSVNAGIDLMRTKELYYTESSENIIDEYKNYSWKLDRNKKPTNKPEDDNNHAMDAIRYGLYTKLDAPFIGIV